MGKAMKGTVSAAILAFHLRWIIWPWARYEYPSLGPMPEYGERLIHSITREAKQAGLSMQILGAG